MTLQELPSIDRLYEAMLAKDTAFEGIVFVGVKTTGIVCRLSCPARTPKKENVEFFSSAEAAIEAGYRPCLRCKPLSKPNTPSYIVTILTEYVAKNPENKWSSDDLRALGFDPSTVRRHFKSRYGMTFLSYARAQRISAAHTGLKSGSRVVDSQVDVDYDSGSGFREAFTKIMGKPPSKSSEIEPFYSSKVDTPLGPMLLVADNNALHILEFSEEERATRESERHKKRTSAPIIPGTNQVLEQASQELEEYFDGKRSTFETPIQLWGTEFQRGVWNALLTIPIAITWSYKELAIAVNNPPGVRAVAQANGANQLAIIVPCHRVIQTDGKLGGYGGKLWRKQWLLDHEKRHFAANAGQLL